ncbi:MAG: hypothetical protein IH609_00875, partial [Dehalococcoidia bacterium]|nr:hypothetical protein [Dehalococcoidia bacterium]
FFSAGSIVQAYGTRRLHRMGNLGGASPAVAVVFIAAIIGVSGFPPFALFVSEFGLVSGAFAEDRGMIAVAGMLFVALAAAMLLFQIFGTVFRGKSKGPAPRRIGRVSLVTAAFPLLLAVWVAFAPPTAVRDLIEDAAAVMEARS